MSDKTALTGFLGPLPDDEEDDAPPMRRRSSREDKPSKSRKPVATKVNRHRATVRDSKRITIEIEIPLLGGLDAMAEQTGEFRYTLVNHALREYLVKNGVEIEEEA